MAAIPRLLDYDGPAILSYGFRPFYLLGALYAGLAVIIWLPVHTGAMPAFGLFSGRDWHVHELLYGYLTAVVAGYLLASVPNWTGKLPVQGGPLLVLVIVWTAGRGAVTFSGAIGWLAAFILDAAFLLLMMAVVVRESVAARSLRNAHIIAVLGVLLAGNAFFHLENQWYGTADIGVRLGVAAVVLLIVMIGGRIIPSFTRNWLARQATGRIPAPVGIFDQASMGLAAAGLGLWVFEPYGHISAALLAAAGIAHAVRLARWAGDRTWRNPLVAILHIGYAFIPVGFLLTALSALGAVPSTAGLHAWTAGAMGTMTLAIMTRTSLGLTGRPRVVGWGTQLVYALVVIGALLRVGAGLGWTPQMALHLAGTLWAAAFLGFAAVYWTVLTGPRVGR